MNKLSSIYVFSHINNIFLYLIGMKYTSMATPFITWRTKTYNPSSLSQLNLVIYTPTTMGPIQKWIIFTTMSRRLVYWSMAPIFLPHHMRLNLVEAWDPFKVSSRKIIMEIFIKTKITPLQSSQIWHQHPVMFCLLKSIFWRKVWIHQWNRKLHHRTYQGTRNQHRWSNGFPPIKGYSTII